MNPAQLINQTSGVFEYYTPSFIVEAARKTMGSITLDPFSSVIANERVKAENFYTIDDDGFKKDWFGNVWCNHPFGRDYNKRFVTKLFAEYDSGYDQVCCITFACTSELWFKPLLYFPQCFLSPRTNYHLPDGTLKTGVTKGSVVTYLGKNVDAFKEHFFGLGVVKI